MIQDVIRVIRPISQHRVCINPLNQGTSLAAICCGTFCNKDSDRHTMRIHGYMQFCVEPPFLRLIAWFPPLAPAA